MVLELKYLPTIYHRCVVLSRGCQYERVYWINILTLVCVIFLNRSILKNLLLCRLLILFTIRYWIVALRTVKLYEVFF